MSPRGFSTAAARVHGPATWILNVPVRSWALLLEHVEVVGEQRPGAAQVDAGCVGQPPAGRLQVEPEVGDQARVRPIIEASAPRAGSSGR